MHAECPTPIVVRVARVRRGATVALAALACAALMSACGSSASSKKTTKTDLNTARVAHSIEQSILAQRHLASTVVCPAVVAQEKGRIFECIATTPSAKKPSTLIKTPFVVTVQNSSGYVTYTGK